MAFEVKLVLFEPGDVKLLTTSAALQLTDNVFFVVTHNPALALACAILHWLKLGEMKEFLT